MNQALHIFKKDVRYLRLEVALLLACAAIFAASKDSPFPGGWEAPLLLRMVWAFVCARLIQAETIPGDRQFWITRPYEWRSLLGSKLMFVAAFMSAPLLVADALILARNGFPLVASLPGLLFSIVLITVGFMLALSAFAAVTRGLVQWILSGLAAVLVISQLGNLEGWTDWGGVEWMRNLGGVAILFMTASCVMFWQYRYRRTMLSRIAVAAGLLGSFAYGKFAPPAAAWAIETRFSKAKADSSAIQLALHPPAQHAIRYGDGFNVHRTGPQNVVFPLDVSRLGAGMDLTSDTARVTINRPNGDTWSWVTTDASALQHGANGFLLVAAVDGKVFEKAKWEKVRLSVEFQLTLLGNAVRTPVEWGAGRAPVPGVGLCTMIQLRESLLVSCASALREASSTLAITAETGEDRRFFVGTSYSPFPADLSFAPISHFVQSANSSSVILTTRQPLAHFRRDIEVRDVILADYQPGLALTQK